MALQTIVSALTHPGQKRSHNQDFVAHFEPDNFEDYQVSGSLYIVADGVGGESQGDVASRYAAQKVMYEYFRQPQIDINNRLTQLIRQAGNEIHHYAEEGINYRRIATTMVAAVIKDDFLTVANVGDSRAYLIRDGAVKQITKDHSLLGEKIRSGALTEEEALTTKVKNRITRSLGGETNVRVDIFQNIPLQAGDQILLCSDGLTQYTTSQILAQLILGKRPKEASQGLIDYANQQGGSDNISVILIELTDSPSEYPTQIPQREIPVPDDWDTMSTSPGGKIGRVFKKTGSVWVLTGIIGLLGLIIIALASFVFLKLTSPKVDRETPTASAWEVDSQIRETIDATTPGVSESATPAATPTVEGESQPPATVETISAPIAKQTEVGNRTKPSDKGQMTLVFIRAGAFWMGRDQVILEEEFDEQPSHQIVLDSFWIDQTEVTNTMYAEYLNERGNEFEGHWLYSNNGKFARIDELDGGWAVQPDFVDHPVNGVSWFGAKAYCEWVGRRLPTEAEWEKAARGRLTGKVYPWGNEDPTCTNAQFAGCVNNTVPVKSTNPNDYGLYGMAGNVWEWVNDWHDKDYYTNSPEKNPPGPIDGDKRVIRGGSWKHIKELMATYTREEALPNGKGVEFIYLYGFRCAQDAP